MKQPQLKILLFLFILFLGNVTAQTPNVTIPNISAPAGKDIDLDIQVSDLTGLQVFSVDYTLVFKTNLLQVLEVIGSGSISAQWGNPTVNISSGQVVVSLAGVDPLIGSGNLVRIRFHVSETASTGESSDLLFINFKFNDGQPQANIQNGTFTVTGDLNPPQIVSGPTIVEKNYFYVKIHVETDEPSAILILYGETTFYGQDVSDANFSFSHTLSLSNLHETTNYYYQIQLTDSLNNGPGIYSGYAFGTKNVTLNLPNITADPGTNIDIPVTIPDFTGLNVKKISVEVLFDQAQLQVSGIKTIGTVLSSWSTPQISIFSNKVILTAEHTTALQGGGALFFIDGKVPATAVLNQLSDLNFDNVALNDGQIKLITNNGSITIEDRLPPLIVSGPTVSNISSNSATIQWQTNESATSLISYGESSSYNFSREKEAFVTDHNFVLTNLDPGITYHFQVGGKDLSGNGPNWSANATFSTTDTDVTVGFPDTTVNVGTTLWIPLQTSDISDYAVKKWDALIGYDSNKLEFINILQENTLISNWNPVQIDTTAGFISVRAHGSFLLQVEGDLIFIGFQIKNISNTNQPTVIALLNFRFDEDWPAVTTYNSRVNIVGKTDQQPPEIFWGPFVDKISNSSARFFWRTNELSYAEVEYGTTAGYGNNLQTTKLDTLHQVTATGLQPGTQYHYRVRNRDVADNISPFSADSTFTTLPGNSVAVSIPVRSVDPGETIDIPIQMGNLSGLDVYSCDIEIAYDETKISAISASSNGCLSSVWGSPVYTLFPGRLVIAAGGIQALQGSGDLVRVKFHVMNTASASDLAIIRFINIIFNDENPLASFGFGGIRIKDNIPPSLIVGPVVLDRQPNSAMIAWQTDELANSRVYFGINSPNENLISNESLSFYHTMLLDGLSPAITYKYRIASEDSSGNDWISPQAYQFTTSSINQLIFTIKDQTADLNQNIWIPLLQSGSSSRPIFALNFDLAFNPNLLEFKDFLITAAEATDWNKEYQEITNGNVHFHIQGDQPIAQNGELLKFQFKTQESQYNTSLIKMINVSVNGDTSNISVFNGLFKLVDKTSPVFVTEPIVSQIRATSANIAWQTDEPTFGFIVYNKLESSQDTVKLLTPTIDASYTLTDLQPISTYEFNVGITDTSVNGPVWSEPQQFTTTAGDEVDLILPDTSFAIGDTVSIPITLGTIPGIPIIKYQFALIFDSDFLEFLNTIQLNSLTEPWLSPATIIQDDSLIVSHSSSQGILRSGTLLFLQFVIREQAQHQQKIPLRFKNFSFNDGAPPASITNGSIRCLDLSPPEFRFLPVVEEIHPKSVVIKVGTDEPTKLKVDYGETSALGTRLEISELDTLHLIKIDNLLQGQIYYFRVEALDSLDNGPAISEILSFQTAKATVYVSIPDTTISTGEPDFLLPIKISDVTGLNIKQYELQINYDHQAISPLGVSIENSLSSAWSNSTFSSDNKKIIFSNSGIVELQGSGALFWLKFHQLFSVQQGDSTELKITQAIFQNGALPAESNNGVIRFVKEDTAEIEVSLPDTSVYRDSQFELGLKISDVSEFNIRSYSSILLFDNDILGLEKIETDNTLTENWPAPSYINIGDSLKINHTGTEPLTGAGNLLKFQFYVKPGLSEKLKSDLIILNFEINHSTPIANIISGSVTVVEKPNAIIGYIKNKRQPNFGVSEVQVYAQDSTAQIVSNSISDSTGYFQLSNLDWKAAYQIYALKTGYSPSDTLQDIYPSYKQIDLYLLKQDGIISGQIKDNDTKPIPQSIITVNDQHDHFGTASSNQDGEFQLAKLDRRFPYQLTVTKYGFENKSLDNISIENHDTTFTIVLDWKYGKISGFTLDNQNEPITDVTIKIFYQSSGEQVTEQQTDNNGFFQMDSLKADSYLVVAHKSGFLNTPKQQLVNLAPEEVISVEFHLKPFQLASIQITGESYSIPNDQPTQFSFTALSDSGETIDQLEGLEWQFLPEAAGLVLDGMVYPDSQYVGAASLILNEINSGISDTANLFIYVNINPDQSFQLHDDEGMELIFPLQATERTFQLKFDIIQLQSIKGATRSHLIIGKGYDFKPAGIEFLKPIILRLPVPELHQGQNLSVGNWDPTRAEWHILSKSKSIGSDKIEAEIENFSLFALLYPSKPLGVHNIKLTPNPFSPQVDSDGDGILGVNISFYVTSKTIRQPFVSIKIYSLYGELVRNLIIDKPLDKGKSYFFNWDGKTEMNRLARNGRYLVQIEVKGQKETKNYLKQVVLIK